MGRLTLTVDSFVSFDFRGLKRVDSNCWKEIRKAFTHRNPDFFKARNLGYSTEGIPQRLKTYQLDGRKIIRVNRGNLAKLRKILRKHGHAVRIEDNRVSFPPVKFSSNITPHDYQEKPIEVLVDKQQGLVRGDCSTGKTVILLEAIARAKQPAVVIVHSTNLQKQWIKEAKNFLGLTDGEIGGVGGVFKKRKFGKLNICMQQSLWRGEHLDFFAERVGFVAVDEVQKTAANTFQTSVNSFPALYRVGASANERRKDGKEFLIYATFGKVLHHIPKSATRASRMEAKIFLVPTRFKISNPFAEFNQPALINEITECPVRNAQVIHMVKRSLRKKRLCLVLTERVEHALLLSIKLRKYRVGLMIGNQPASKVRALDWPVKLKKLALGYDADVEFERVTRLASKRKLDVIIATQKGDVGLSIKTIDDGFITTPTGNNTERFNQQKGRVERRHKGKMNPRIYYFWDVKNERLREAGNNIKRTFPGTSVLRLSKQRKESV